jgi:oxygen-independent coproporphyrinogen-3 oxidase
MYGLPGQDRAGALRDLGQALSCGPPHLSLYSLTLEPGTPFFQHPPALPDEDAHADIEAALHDALRAAGYVQYEISAWARPGSECRHNRNYWSFGDYLGIGAGAHAKITRPDGTIVREERRRVPAAYLEDARAGRFVAASRHVDGAERVFEFGLCALRLAEGFTPALFEERTGLPFSALSPAMSRARIRGLLQEGTDPVRASALGWRFLSDLQECFLAP